MEQRLIDANACADDLWKLRVNFQMLDDTHTADKIMHGIYLAERTLQIQPTVDAVSIEQIEEFSAWLERNGYTLLKKAIIKALHDYRTDGERKDGEHEQ